MARYKVLVVEVDGAELDVQTEVPLDADRVFYDSSVSGLLATNIQDAITELAAATGGADNFSYSTVSNRTVAIPVHQQMIVLGELTLVGTGDLVVNGEVALLNWS